MTCPDCHSPTFPCETCATPRCFCRRADALALHWNGRTPWKSAVSAKARVHGNDAERKVGTEVRRVCISCLRTFYAKADAECCPSCRRENDRERRGEVLGICACCDESFPLTMGNRGPEVRCFGCRLYCPPHGACQRAGVAQGATAPGDLGDQEWPG